MRRPAPADASAPSTTGWARGGATSEFPPVVNELAMPSIGRLAREGAIELCSDAGIRRPPGAPCPGRALFDLLGEVAIVSGERAIDRTAIDGDVFRDAVQPGALRRFDSRLEAGQRALESLPEDSLARLLATSRRRVASLERCGALAARTQGEHLVDLFYMRTGELAGCQYFLTLDDRFTVFLDQRVRPGLRAPLACNPVEPRRRCSGLESSTGTRHRRPQGRSSTCSVRAAGAGETTSCRTDPRRPGSGAGRRRGQLQNNRDTDDRHPVRYSHARLPTAGRHLASTELPAPEEAA